MSETDPLLSSGGEHAHHQHQPNGTTASIPLNNEADELRSNATLKAQGHEPELERSFSLLAALGLGFSITNSWIGYMACFGVTLNFAGTNGVVFGLLLAVILQWMISAGLYEIASCFPSAGGQYHFVFILAPEGWKKFAAYMVGWMNILGWSVALCAGVSVTVTSVAGLISLWIPTFEVTQARSYGIYLAISALSACPLFATPRAIPKILTFNLIFSIVGFVVAFILLFVLHHDSQPWSSLKDTQGHSGWHGAMAWTLGLTNSMYVFSATDSVLHIAEEIVSPEKRLPQVLDMTLGIGIATAFPLILAMMLFMMDKTSILGSDLPYGQLFLESTGSKVVTTIVIAWVALALYSALIGQWVTTGRLVWAFARDGGLPYSSFFAHVNQTYGFPVRTTVLMLVFCAVYGLLYLISTVAFNSILGSAVLFSNITYCIPGAIVAFRGRENVLPRRDSGLGAFGGLLHYISPVLVIVIGFFLCLPPELPQKWSNINYTPAILVAAYLGIWASWYVMAKNFKGPKIDWEILKNTKVP